MVDFLTQYFFRNGVIVLPGLGQLTLSEVPARYDITKQQMLPPENRFIWQQPLNQTDLPLQPLLAFISRKTGISEEDCFALLTTTIQEINQSVETTGEWVWPQLGKLVHLSEGKTGFVPKQDLSSYAPKIFAPRVARREKKHPILVGDKETDNLQMQLELDPEGEETVTRRWWIPALILGMATIGFIIARAMGWW